MAIASRPAAKKIRCPKCGGVSFYSTQNAYRPFCSQRCKLLDLGAWANDEYSIPGSSAEAPLLEDSEGISPSEKQLQ
jgi:endogenous inhibitor of DNA gyrase (YacG/DUF329 family)